MARIPEEASDDTINRLFEDELKPALALKAAWERLEKAMNEPPEPTSVPELMFHTQKRHNYTFERVPFGHDMGWRCFDPNRYDGDPADGDTTCGYGMTEDAAYIDYLNQLEDEKPVQKSGTVVHSSPFEPPTVVPSIYQDPDEE